MRKLKELLLALQLEKSVKKNKILEIYLNIAEWGEGFFGINDAARIYFQKEPSQLTAKEGAFLAMLLPSPHRYGQSFRKKKMTRFAMEMIDSILEKMVQAGYLDSERVDQEKQVPFSFEVQ